MLHDGAVILVTPPLSVVVKTIRRLFLALTIILAFGGWSARDAAAQWVAARSVTPQAPEPLAGVERLRDWLTAVERHEPGKVDGPALAISGWSRFELDAAWADLRALLDRANGVASRVQRSGEAATIKTASGPLTLAEAQDLLRLTDDEIRRRDPTRIVKRAAVLHADLAVFVSLGLLVDASYAGMVLGESDVGRSLVLVFSDGLDSGAWLSPDEVLDIARRSDAVVYGVSAGQSPKSDFLADLSETTGGKLFKVESTKDLSAAFLSVLDEFRHRYVVSYSPRNVSPDGWHQLIVRVRGRNATVKARPGYFAGS